MKVAIIGAGNVGRALNRALEATTHSVRLFAARSRRRPKLLEADIVVLAVRDGALSRWAQELAEGGSVDPGAVVVHVAGALDPEVLAPLRDVAAGIGQMHPMISFASRSRSPNLLGGHVLVSGDRLAVRRAKALVVAIGAVPRQWPSLDRALYHAAGGVVANGAAALAAQGAELLRRGGVPAKDVNKVLGPLLRSVAENIESLGLPTALTGPVRRGDARAIEKHLTVLPRASRALYLALAKAQLSLAREIGDASPRDLRDVANVIRSFEARTKP